MRRKTVGSLMTSLTFVDSSPFHYLKSSYDLSKPCSWSIDYEEHIKISD